MKKTIGAIVAALVAAVLLTGCPTKPIDEAEPGVATVDKAGPDTSEMAGRSGYTAEDLNDPSSPLYQRVIYFAYDSDEIQPQFIEILRAHAAYLAGSQSARVILEGHTDERGTREYNLALGDHRADTVRRFLLAEGVPEGRIQTMSYGEERPADTGHTEPAWALNRRVQLVY